MTVVCHLQQNSQMHQITNAVTYGQINTGILSIAGLMASCVGAGVVWVFVCVRGGEQ